MEVGRWKLGDGGWMLEDGCWVWGVDLNNEVKIHLENKI